LAKPWVPSSAPQNEAQRMKIKYLTIGEEKGGERRRVR
jgi:hypothetical protein